MDDATPKMTTQRTATGSPNPEPSAASSSAGEPIAIVGTACLFPKAPDLATYWSNICQGVDAIEEIPASHWKPDDYFDPNPAAPDKTYARRGGFLPTIDFDPLEFGIAPNTLEATDTAQLLALYVAKRALQDAGYERPGSPDNKPLPRDRTSVIMGVTGAQELVIPLGARLGHPLWRRALAEAGVDADTAEDVVQRISDGYVSWQEQSFPGLLGNVVAGRIANRLDLHGTNCVVDAACASSLSALHLAMLELQLGRADLALAGGSDTFNDIFMYMCFSKTPALSPTGDSRPFDAQSDGTILGEGVGVVVLKRLSDAQRDGDRILAVVRGMGTASDGKGAAVYAPQPPGQVRTLRDAYRNAGVAMDTIELIEAHGTGTKVGDATEIKALAEAFGGQAGSARCAVGSVKSQIGHTKAAAGIAGVIKAALALYHGVLPPTIKVRSPADPVRPEAGPFYVNTCRRPWLPNPRHPRRAGVSSFGFGGSNFHCVLEEAPRPNPVPSFDGQVQVIPLSASTPAGLAPTLEKLAAATGPELRHLARLCRSSFRPTDECRLVLIVEAGRTDLSKLLGEVRRQLDTAASARSWSLPDGAYFCRGPKAGKLALLFPGQGSQYVNMLLDLACTFPQFRAVLAEADAAWGVEQRLSDYLYPRGEFGPEDRQRHEDRLRPTQVAQPALGAVSLAAWQVLSDFGVRPDAAAGHSFGELVALGVGQRLHPESLRLLAKRRGELMAAEGQVGGSGAMLAVAAPADEVERFLHDHRLDVTIANYNAPRQVVLSGPADVITRAESLLVERRWQGRRLPVSAAFHSPLVAGAERHFRATLERVPLQPARLAVFANTTGKVYPDDPAAARDLLAGQLARPVQFVEQVRNMHRFGVQTFVEVGPGAVLTGLTRSILEGGDFQAAAIDASRGKRSGVFDLANVLGLLAAQGHPVDLAKWDPPQPNELPLPSAQAARRLTVPLNGANYRKPIPPRPPRARSQPPARATADSAATSTEFLASSESPLRTQPCPGERTMNEHPTVVSRSQPAEPSPAPAAAAPEVLALLQRLQEDTARLHQQFLRGQSEALQVLQRALTGAADLPMPSADVRVSPPRAASPTLRPSMALVKPAAPADLLEPVTAAEPATPSDRLQNVDPLAMPFSEPQPAQPTLPVVVAPVSRSADHGILAETLLAVVAEKTGYPTSMLELGMTLEGDLGIDSIKRVEILSALAEKLPHAGHIGADRMGELQSLADVVRLLAESAPAEILSPAVAAIPARPITTNHHTAVQASEYSESTPGVPAATALDPALTAGIIAVVAEKTGYPAEMLDISMSLEGDLGIDSIKRVEILAAVQERWPNLPAVASEHLGSLVILADVIAAMAPAGIATLAPVMAAASLPPTLSAPAAASRTSAAPAVDPMFAEALLQVVAAKTGYPTEMLQLSQELEGDLGIDSIKRVEILAAMQERLPHLPHLAAEELGTLRTLQDIVDCFAASAPADEPAALPAAAALPAPAAPLPPRTAAPLTSPARVTLERSVPHAVPLADPTDDTLRIAAGSRFWVIDDGGPLGRCVVDRLRLLGVQAELQPLTAHPVVPPTLHGLILLPPVTGTTDEYLTQAFLLTKAVAPRLRSAGGPTAAFLLTVSRLDGRFGLGGQQRVLDPLSGGLAGLAKTARHEWPEVTCRALDLAADLDDPAEAAAALVQEIRPDRPAEVGLSAHQAVAVEIRHEPLQLAAGAPPVQVGDVVVVSGGARGVTAAAAQALARRTGCKLALLGRSPSPEPEPAWLKPLTSEAEIQAALLRQPGTRPNPRLLRDETRRWLANREIVRALEELRQAGIQAEYFAADLRDPQSTRAALDAIRHRMGVVRGIVHGAGVLADKRIEEKTAEQFRAVYDTKVVGLRHLLASVSAADLSLLALFSSYTARHGRRGQVDYAMANEVLNKTAWRFAAQHPTCKVVAFNWGPWEGGMVTPELRGVFAAEGVGLIPLQAGAELFVDELASARSRAVEVLVMGPTPAGSAKPAATANTATHARTSEGLTAREGTAAPPQPPFQPTTAAPAFASAPSGGRESVAFEREISRYSLPILESHVLGGKLVVPAALLVEWCAQAAIHAQPGTKVAALRQFQVWQGVKLAEDEQTLLRLLVNEPAGPTSLQQPVAVAAVSGQGVRHAGGAVDLRNLLPAAPASRLAVVRQPYRFDPADYYTRLLFHGPDLYAVQEVVGCSPRGITAQLATAPLPSEWMRRPLRQHWLVDPMVLDGVFQSLILWCRAELGVPCLPTGLETLEIFGDFAGQPEAEMRAEVVETAPGRAVFDVECLNPQGKVIYRLERVQTVVDAALERAFARPAPARTQR